MIVLYIIGVIAFGILLTRTLLYLISSNEAKRKDEGE